jgi:deoxycytidylate deaminase
MKYYNLLKQLSEKSDHHRHKMSCVITRKGRVIGRGFNSISTSPNSPHPWGCKHAEYNAFINSGRDIKGATVYVFRENKNGVPSMARPCSSCFKFLVENGAKLIIYSFEGSYKEEKLK